MYPMVLWYTPKLYKRCDKLTLISLGANMSQTHNQIVLQQTLYGYIAINLVQIEVDGQSVDHFKLIPFHKVIQHVL